MTKFATRAAAAVVLAAALTTLPAAASTWCGENGVVRLSFTKGDTLQSVATIAPPTQGPTLVDIWAYLDDVDPVEIKDEKFTGIGGLEMRLVIDGAEGAIVKQDFPFVHVNVSPSPGLVLVGIDPGQKLQQGRALLVHWQVAFMQPPQDVTFRLDPNSLQSCKTMPDCVGSGSYALYTGTVASNLVTYIAGAGCAPAFLNWKRAPELRPLRGKTSWQDVGVMTPLQ
jgi:hypothetical protein